MILKFSGIYIFPNCTKIIPIKRLKKENVKKKGQYFVFTYLTLYMWLKIRDYKFWDIHYPNSKKIIHIKNV